MEIHLLVVQSHSCIIIELVALFFTEVKQIDILTATTGNQVSDFLCNLMFSISPETMRCFWLRTEMLEVRLRERWPEVSEMSESSCVFFGFIQGL